MKEIFQENLILRYLSYFLLRRVDNVTFQEKQVSFNREEQEHPVKVAGLPAKEEGMAKEYCSAVK